MFLARVRPLHSGDRRFVFCLTDPRRDGYTGPVEERVDLDVTTTLTDSWRDGSDTRVLGRDPDTPKRYRVFASAGECLADGYYQVGPMPVLVARWSTELEVELAGGGRDPAGVATVNLLGPAAMTARQMAGV